MFVKSCYVRKIGYEMACIIYQNSGEKTSAEQEITGRQKCQHGLKSRTRDHVYLLLSTSL